MLRDELITLIGWRLGDRDDMAARAVSEMQYTQQYILEANSWLPWFLEADAVGLATEAGIRSVPLPVDFLREIEAARPYLILADGTSLRKFLKPGTVPEAEFSGVDEKASAREYCNIHGLWKA